MFLISVATLLSQSGYHGFSGPTLVHGPLEADCVQPYTLAFSLNYLVFQTVIWRYSRTEQTKLIFGIIRRHFKELDTLFSSQYDILRGTRRQHESRAVTSRGAVESVSWGRNSDNRKSTRKPKLLNWPTASVWRRNGGFNDNNHTVDQFRIRLLYSAR